MDFLRRLIKIVLLRLILSNSVEATCYSPESCLRQELFANYDSKARPSHNPQEAIQINVSLVIRSLDSINEKQEVMTITGWIAMEWSDPDLSWSPSSHRETSNLVLYATDIWLPDTVVINSAEAYYKSTYKEDFRVAISNTGGIRWRFGGHISTNCPLDITYYPFDEQVCKIVMENWEYPISMVDLQFREVPLPMMSYGEHSLWDLKKTRTERVVYGVGLHRYPLLVFELHWQRKPLYYIYTLVVPCLCITGISLMMFWLPPSCGEKVSLGITVLLAFSVFQIIIADNTPVNSDNTPVLSRVVLFVTLMATLSLIIAIVTVYLDSMSDVTTIPRIVRVIAFKYLARVLFLSKEVPSTAENIGSTAKVHPQITRAQVMTVTDMDMTSPKEMVKATENQEMQDVLHELRKITDYIEQKETVNSRCDEWKLLAKVIDRCLFWVCFACTLVYGSAVIIVLASR